MNQQRTPRFVRIIVVALVGVAVLAVATGRFGGGGTHSVPDASAAYPPPPPPTGTPDPTPDSGGLFPAPSGISTTDTTISSSDFPRVLYYLDTAVANADSSTLTTSYMGPSIHVADSSHIHYSAMLTRTVAAGVLDTFFANSTPHLQGYFPWSQGSKDCLIVFSATWNGPATVGLWEGIGGLGVVTGDAFRWSVCPQPSNPDYPLITDWMFGPYYDLIYLTYGTLGTPTYFRLVP